MARFRHFDKTWTAGGPSASILTSINLNGSLCYIGHGQYASGFGGGGANAGIHLWNVDDANVKRYSHLVTLTGTTGTGDCRGVAYNGHGKLFALVHRDITLITNATIQVYDVATGTLDAEIVVGASSITGGAIAFDGQHVLVSWRDTGIPTTDWLALWEVSGGSGTLVARHDHAAMAMGGTLFTDMSYDGVHLWSLTGVFMSRWALDGANTPTNTTGGAVGGYALPVINSQGIAHDHSNNFQVLSRG